ncbi:barrier-to-autointegration factor-like protein isoform X1 [Rana temporaria]|uniref:barrier-to-autointegration factor-like protein isoform X1 n=1 Tax=Rana temporaria TaxID=8407 RepID=UPI001AAD4DD2|nr:barrier-to-autointegration factor-like protein isoform X1 [Rana temporaria]
MSQDREETLQSGNQEPQNQTQAAADESSPANMSHTSQKHRDFVSEPMGDKPVTALAGIGEVLGGKLEEQGFDKAYVLLGQFLVFKKDADDLFKDWLQDSCGANSRQAELCSSCLKEWCSSFL